MNSAWMFVELLIYSLGWFSLVIADMNPVLGYSLMTRCFRMCMSMLIIQKAFRLIVLHLFLLSYPTELSWISIENPIHHILNTCINLLGHHSRPRLFYKVTVQPSLPCYYQLTYFGRAYTSRHPGNGKKV